MADPDFLARLRPLAKQRPRTQFVKVRWHDLANLIAERDLLWHEATGTTRAATEAARVAGGRGRPVRQEADVLAAFCAWLRADGWDVRAEAGHLDVLATRGGDTLAAEVKGITAEPGLDADTMYGQILRHMEPGRRYAVVVPAAIISSALRVPAEVRNRLTVTVFSVDEAGQVTEV